MPRSLTATALVVFSASLVPVVVAAQAPTVPEPVPGQVVYAPFAESIGITVDGDLADWADLPTITTTTGPKKSPDPAENGSITWSVAADADGLYLNATMPDATIVAGEHGSQYWNEDSLEFYVNFSEDINAPRYREGISQITFSPVDFDNPDPGSLVPAGTNREAVDVSGVVFATDDGWGLEAVVAWPDGFAVEHGTNLGFQVHGNGSFGGNRDVKLIWSVADERDESWDNPSVFGSAVLYELGATDQPEVLERSYTVPTAEVNRGLSVNQHGYLPTQPKYSIFGDESEEPLDWQLVDLARRVQLEGRTEVLGWDERAGENVHLADFSQHQTEGAYRIQVGDQESYSFRVREDLYDELVTDAFRYFYRSRSGIELEPAFAEAEWARPAGHLSDAEVTCYQGSDPRGGEWDGCDYTLDASGGWYDAGDYGKYVVPAAIATWTLLNAYERDPDAWSDAQFPLPEAGNGAPDLLDEARWEIEWMLSMQVPEGQPNAGMVHHKLHDLTWAPDAVLPDPTVDNDNDHSDPASGRYLMPPSTQATLDTAAIGAQCARIWADLDPAFAARCLTAAERAWAAAEAFPAEFTGHVPGDGGGPYDDADPTDERAWAATELYLTTGDERYLEAVMASSEFLSVPLESAPMWWGDVAALGPMSMATVDSDADPALIERAEAAVIAAADWALTQRDGFSAYRIPLGRFEWGSNSAVLNNAIAMGLAHDITGEARYRDGAAEAMDYLLGRNPLNVSFISGYGEDPMTAPHHRFWANIAGLPMVPPGVVAGGVNAVPSDPTAEELVASLPEALRYVDESGSWSTNEVAINWNAPLLWVASYLAGPASE